MADFLYLKHPYTCLKENVVHRWKWKVNSNVNDAGCNTGVIVGMYKPSSQCFKRMIYFLHCFFPSSLWKTSCQFIRYFQLAFKTKVNKPKMGCKQRWQFSSDQLISSFFLRKIFGNEMFQDWSKQLENEGMGTSIGVSSFFHQSITFFYDCVHNIFFLYLPASMDTRPWLNIYILNSNKSKQNVITYCIFIDQWKKISAFLLIFSKRRR